MEEWNAGFCFNMETSKVEPDLGNPVIQWYFLFII